MQPVICIELLYPERTAEEKAHLVANSGFNHIEFWAWRDKNIEALKTACSRDNMSVANFSAHRRGSPVAADTHQTVLADFDEALSTAALLGCNHLMFLSNQLGEGGIVVDAFPDIPEDTKFNNFVEILRQADRIAPPHMNLVIEPLNVKIDHPGNYLQDMQTAAALVDAVGSSRVKVLCDLYHMGVMGFELEPLIRDYASYIGYVHIADIPGRHEPGTGSVDWARMVRTLRDHGYDGYVGFEYGPKASSDDSLAAVRSMWDDAVGQA